VTAITILDRFSGGPEFKVLELTHGRAVAMTRTFTTLIFLGMAVTCASAQTQQNTAADNVQMVVKACVEVAHAQGYQEFDAFYNSAPSPSRTT
jgi:hypothetical protein